MELTREAMIMRYTDWLGYFSLALVSCIFAGTAVYERLYRTKDTEK